MPGSSQLLAPPPAPSADAAWDEAFLRVEAYLRAHRLEGRLQLNKITHEIIEESRRQWLTHQEALPLTVATAVTHARIGEWFARTGLQTDWTDENMRARGRLAFALADLEGRWDGHFLSTQPVPAELTAAMQAFELSPAPALQLTSMSPAPLEFAFDERDSPSPATRKVWLIARAAGSWLLLMGFFGIAWAASH